MYNRAMKRIEKKISKKELKELEKEFGKYLKLTIDIEKEIAFAGQKLHADAEKILLEEGSLQNDIWGGGIDFRDKLIDTTAVMNLRMGLKNDSMEILDPQKREKFVKIVKKLFSELWH